MINPINLKKIEDIINSEGGNMSKRNWYISLFLSNSNVQHYLVVGESREESIICVVNLFEELFKQTVTKVISKELK